MATEIGKAYVQILPSTKGMVGKIKSEMGGAGEEAGESLGSSMVGKLKGVIAAAGIGAVVKQALDAGGAIEQSFGGLDTIYGEASEAAKQYASEAASAGISMNDYAEQAVSFGASLKMAFGGDTAKAAEAANTAILDMADNAAKMGTPLESIQNAYQGFAKGQFNMLDNLKLGYGGTKSEMERLLKDAQKITGVKYDMDNLGDVYDAIHVIQGELGLTGVAAAEASETLSGSMGAIKASFQNVLAMVATGGDIGTALDTLGQNIMNFAFNNLIPMLGNVFKAIPDLLQGLLSNLMMALRKSSGGNMDGIVQTFVDVVKNIGLTLLEMTPYLIEAGFNLIKNLGQAIISYDWIGLARDIINEAKNTLSLAASEILGEDSFFSPNLIKGIKEKIPEIAKKALEIVAQFAYKLMDSGNIQKVITAGLNIIQKLIVGLLNAIPKVIAAIPKIIASIKDTFGKYDWKTVGKNILEGIAEGIKNFGNVLWDAVKECAQKSLDAAKEALGIHSPSKVFANEVGAYIPSGIALGIKENSGAVTDAMNDIANMSVAEAASLRGVSSTRSNLGDVSGVDYEENIYKLLSNLLPVIAEKDSSVRIEGDASRMFSVMQSKARQYNRQTGKPAFL